MHTLDLIRPMPHLTSMTITIASFYRFHPLQDPARIQAPLLATLKSTGAKGSVLLASEGVNGTIAAPPGHVDLALQTIAEFCGLPELERKYASAPALPFKRLKVRLKKEIVSIGEVPADPNIAVGEYVQPADWNALICDPDVLLVDTRNTYEVRVGSFRNALDPQTESFRQFPAWVRAHLSQQKHRKIAMFCTGGIRCEKASSFMKFEGFENVYHLKGGILNYLEVIPQHQSLWEGACYVFDERVAVDHNLAPSDFTTCYGCLMPMSAADRLSPLYEEGVCCVRCADKLSEVQKASNRERQRQFELARRRGMKHLGPAD